MGCFDIFCALCGNPPHYILENYSIDDNFYNELFKITEWMKDCVILTASNEIILNTKEESCNNYFKGGYSTYPYLLPNDIKRGIFLHSDCYKFAIKKYDINFNIFPINYNPRYEPKTLLNENRQVKINYKNSKYWHQDYDYVSAYKEMYNSLLSPLKAKNPIVKLSLTQLKIKKHRTGPSLSATFADENDYMLGNDNNIWIRKKNKWTFYDEIFVDNYKINKKQELNPKLSKYSQIGEKSIIPFFIEVKKDYVNVIYCIETEKYAKQIQKYI